MKVVWDIYDFCNLKCKYCGATEYKKTKNKLSVDEMKKVINNFDGLVDEVELFGGEPFLVPDFLNILKALTHKGIFVTITTNGQQDTELLNAIADNNINIRNLCISIDGDEAVNDLVRGKGTYAVANFFLEKAIDLKRQGRLSANVGVSAVLTTINAKTIGPQLSRWIDQGVDTIIISPVAEIGRAKEYKELLPSAEQLLDSYESIGKNIAGKEWEKKIYLDIEYPLIGEYLNAKYGTKFSIEKYGCEAVDHILYVNSEGYLKACRESSATIADLRREGICDKLQRFETFLNYRRNHVIEKNCDCIYAQKCIICCFSSDENKSKICSEIERKYDMENWQRKLLFELTEKCCQIQDEKSDYYAIQYFCPNERVEYDKVGFDILKSICKKKKNAMEISRETGMDVTLVFRFLIQSYSKGYIYRTEVC